MALRGEAGWQATYQKAFGKERWPGLSKALKGAVHHVALVNPFLPAEHQARICEEKGLRPHGTIPRVYEFIGEGVEEEMKHDDGEGIVVPAEVVAAEAAAAAAPPSLKLPEQLMPCYYLDGASAVAAQALGVEPGMKVLDLCAAPGGKSVLLASMLFPGGAAAKGSVLVCNEFSRPRAMRLQKVLSTFLPSELMAVGGRTDLADAGGVVHITTEEASIGRNGTPIPIRRLGPFDRVLVDAPCTSDRHLLRKGKAELSHWAAGAVKGNAERQLEILQCAAALVKPGGRLLYCTCALAELENDGVVAKFLKKDKGEFEVELPPRSEDGEGVVVADLLQAEATSSGALFLPDRSSYGPMFVASLIKAAR